MPVPHVFQRSTKGGVRQPYQEIVDRAATTRMISAQLGNMLDRVEGADLQVLAYLLEMARIEAERLVAGGTA